MTIDSQRLLGPGDVPPVEIVNPGGSAHFLLIGDHSGNLVPSALGTLGVSDAERARHIGWDIGIEGLGRVLAERLDAVFVRQRYSRLVIDCNRNPESPAAVPPESDGTAIPGNMGLDDAGRRQRVAEIHAPYQEAVAEVLQARGDDVVLVAIHSFTPAMSTLRNPRPWHFGILHNGANDRFALRLLDWLAHNAGAPVGDNEPYRMDLTDYTVPRHAFAAGLPYVEIEVRQDLLGDAAGIEAVADLLARGLVAAAA